MNDLLRQSLPAVMFLFGTLEIGGSERKFVRLANRFAQRGMPVYAAYLRQPDDLLNELEGVPTTCLDRQGKWSYRAYRNLKVFAAQNQIKTIVAVNFYPLLYAVPLSLLTCDATRVIVSINTSELLSENKDKFLRIYRPLINCCSQVVMGSENQRDLWVTEYGLKKIGTRVIYNGVDIDFFSRAQDFPDRNDVRRKLQIGADDLVFICVGQLRPEKAHGNLLRACAKLVGRGRSDIRLLVVGDGREQPALERLCSELSIRSNVVFVGAVDDVRPYLSAADVFVLASTAVETFSNAALEASSMSLPVVISDVGGAEEMFSGSDGAIIYPRKDVDALMRAMEAQIERLGKESEFGGRLREHVASKFSMERMDDAWIDTLWGIRL